MSEQAVPVTGILKRWASFSARNAKKVILGWFIVVVALGVIAGTAGGSFVDSFKIPGTESQKAVDLLQERFPSAAGDSAQIVFRAPDGVKGQQDAISAILTQAKSLPEVLSVSDPFTDNTISQDGTIAYSTVQYDKSASDVSKDSVDKLLDLVDGSSTTSLDVEAGGEIVSATEAPETGTSEAIGIVAAVLILFFVFGSVVAMGLPILNALVGVILGFLIAMIGAAIFDLNTLTTAFISMIGLGVGIDYSLFIVTRFRESRHSGLSVHDSVVTAVNAAGRAVLFAGTIVIIALFGLAIINLPFVTWMGAAGALVVFLSMLVANGLLPALITVSSRRIEQWTIRTSKPVPVERTIGYRLTSLIQRAPWAWLVAAVIVIAALAAPALDARVGSSDAGNNPTSMHTRRAYDLLAEGFGPGFNGPLLVAISDDNGLQQSTLDALSKAFSATGNVAAVTPANLNPAGDTAILTIIPGTSPQDKATQDLISNLRDNVIPQALSGTDTHAYVGGSTAAFVDMSDKISHGLPLYILLVAGLSIIVLMAVFRSVVVPVKAAVLNLFSFGAAYGTLVQVFQKGHLASLIGVDRTGPIESFVPMILFGILFGLSMDYEVFLVSRVHESWGERRDAKWALSHGIGKSGRVVMAAGAIMVSVFGSFVLGDNRALKEFGIGLSTAIFVDVVVVRLIIVPAFMTIVGRYAWWFPRWLDRVLPRLDIEGSTPAGVHGHPEPVGVGATAFTAADGD